MYQNHLIFSIIQLQDNIWVCLVCGHIGCGRYSFKHAENHYQDSLHVFSMELATGRIWHYEEDTFVHFDMKLQRTYGEMKRTIHERNYTLVSESSLVECIKNMSLFGIPIPSTSRVSENNMKIIDDKNASFVGSKPDWTLLDSSTRWNY